MSEDAKKMQEFIETAKTITENFNAIRDYNNCVVSERAEQLQLQGAAVSGAIEGAAIGGAATLPLRFIPVVGNPVANVFTATAAIVQGDKAVTAARENIAAHNMACAEAAANTATSVPATIRANDTNVTVSPNTSSAKNTTPSAPLLQNMSMPVQRPETSPTFVTAPPPQPPAPAAPAPAATGVARVTHNSVYVGVNIPIGGGNPRSISTANQRGTNFAMSGGRRW